MGSSLTALRGDQVIPLCPPLPVFLSALLRVLYEVNNLSLPQIPSIMLCPNKQNPVTRWKFLKLSQNKTVSSELPFFRYLATFFEQLLGTRCSSRHSGYKGASSHSFSWRRSHFVVEEAAIEQGYKTGCNEANGVDSRDLWTLT